MRHYATLSISIDIDVYQDIERGYHAMHNDPACDDEITAEEVEACRIGDIDIWTLIDAKAREKINSAICWTFGEEISDAIAEAN
jgi:hypothetical protein